MPPTIAYADGYEFQLQSITTFAAGGTALHDFVRGNSVETSIIKNGAASLKLIAASADNARVRYVIPAGNRTMVLSFYVYIDSTQASTTRDIITTTGPTQAPSIRYTGSTGQLSLVGTGWSTTNFGAALSANTWYLIDWKIDVSGTTFTQTATVNGASSGTSTRASSTAADITQVTVGTGTNSGPHTTYYDDFCYGYTLGEYPYGAHFVKLLTPTGDGTHNGGTNTIEKNGGADIGAGTTDAYTMIDEIPPEATDYIQQSTAGSGNYAEVTFADPATPDDIWGVTMYGQIMGAATGVSDMTLRTVDSSGNTLTDMGGVGAVSTTTLRYAAAPVAVPSGGAWTYTKLQGVAGRVGFASDVTPVPRALTFVLQYAGTSPTVSWDSVDMIPI